MSLAYAHFPCASLYIYLFISISAAALSVPGKFTCHVTREQRNREPGYLACSFFFPDRQLAFLGFENVDLNVKILPVNRQ